MLYHTYEYNSGPYTQKINLREYSSSRGWLYPAGVSDSLITLSATAQDLTVRAAIDPDPSSDKVHVVIIDGQAKTAQYYLWNGSLTGPE